MGEVKGAITFRDVSFRYVNESNNIFNNLNFSVKPGSFIAIVGRSGIGKTTILNLMFRLYDPREGTIYLDGHNIKELNF
jgi:ABC-type multidrug transport system fused ATPase/permease subunit